MMPNNRKPFDDFRVPPWKHAEPYFRFPERLRGTPPAKKSPHRVTPKSHLEPVHGFTATDNSLLAIYPDATSITNPMGRELARGQLGLIIGTVGIFGFSLLGIAAADDLFMLALALCGVFFFSLLSFWMYRVTRDVPLERPILFCRKSRSVSYFVPHLPSFWKFWKPVPSEVRTYAWSDTQARTYEFWTGNGVTVTRHFQMWLLWGGENGYPELVKDLAPIGYFEPYGDRGLFMLWEHIRRYMEEDGPPIPAGEEVRELGNDNPLPELPPEIAAAAGGPALSREEVAKLAGTAQAAA